MSVRPPLCLCVSVPLPLSLSQSPLSISVSISVPLSHTHTHTHAHTYTHSQVKTVSQDVPHALLHLFHSHTNLSCGSHTASHSITYALPPCHIPHLSVTPSQTTPLSKQTQSLAERCTISRCVTRCCTQSPEPAVLNTQPPRAPQSHSLSKCHAVPHSLSESGPSSPVTCYTTQECQVYTHSSAQDRTQSLKMSCRALHNVSHTAVALTPQSPGVTHVHLHTRGFSCTPI